MTAFLERYALPLLAGLTGAMILAILIPARLNGTQKSFALVILVGSATAIGWEINRRNAKKHTLAATVSPSMPSIKDSRIYIQAKPSELTSIYQGRTELQANKLAAPYIGKWMKVAGKIHDISTPGGRVLVALVDVPDRDFNGVIFLYFSRELWLERLEILSHGHPITAEGKVTGLAFPGISLEDCELIENV